MDYTVHTLVDAPHYKSVIAERVWRAWWRDDDYRLDEVADLVEGTASNDPFPLTLVAVSESGTYLGSVSGIESDFELRPQFTPWLAALWVEPQHRRIGVARTLISELLRRLFALGHDQVYLYAKPDISDYYMRQGWKMLERDVDGMDVLIFSRESRVER